MVELLAAGGGKGGHSVTSSSPVSGTVSTSVSVGASGGITGSNAFPFGSSRAMTAAAVVAALAIAGLALFLVRR
jgi:DhnA family fructose-bisphosphate aldolase class Ia